MLGAKGVMYFMIIFVLCSLFSSICNLGWYGSEETAQLRWLTTIMDTGISMGNLVTVTKSFFTEGIPALITWDYGFLTGAPWRELIRFILFVITAIGFVWTIVVIVFPIAASMLAGLGNGLMGLMRR